MKKILIAVCFMVASALAGCADEGDACSAVTNMGFSSCRVSATHYVGVRFYGCHNDDHAFVLLYIVLSHSKLYIS